MTDPTPPRLRPSNPATLFVAGLAAAAVGWLLLSAFYYSTRTPLPWLPSLSLAGLAVFEVILAVNTRARIERRPGQPKVEPLAVARYAVLAKASALAGAIFAGFSAGLLAFLLLEPTEAASADVPAAATSLVTSLALVGAALWLERSCLVPDRPEDDERRSG